MYMYMYVCTCICTYVHMCIYSNECVCVRFQYSVSFLIYLQRKLMSSLVCVHTCMHSI